MKTPIRAALMASALTLMVAAPVLADPPTTTHVSSSDCFTIDTLTYCSESEADIWVKDEKSGETSLRMDQWSMSTVTDANGNLVSSFEVNNNERDTVLVAEGGLHFINQNVRQADESMVDGVTSCTRYRILIKKETERINEAVTTPGPC